MVCDSPHGRRAVPAPVPGDPCSAALGDGTLETRFTKQLGSLGVAGSSRVPLVLMVSGGSDSTALLHLAATVSRCAGGALARSRLHVIHVDHRLRGAASQGDADFVAEMCRELDIPCTIERIDVGALAKEEHGNVEAIGRRERHLAAGMLLDDLCDEAGVARTDGRILTAHTRDDRIETFLMRAAVGTGPGGLSSIRLISGRVDHPLLTFSRGELRSWLTSRGLMWREDASNLIPDHDRTFVRLRIVPLLRRLRPAFDANLARTMDLLADEDGFLAQQATELLRSLEVADSRRAVLGVGPSDVCLDAIGLTAAPRVLARRVVRLVVARVGGPAARVGSRRIEEVVNGARRNGFATDLPGSISVRNAYPTLVFQQRRLSVPSFAPSARMQRAGTSPTGMYHASEPDVSVVRGGTLDAVPWGGWLAIPGECSLPGNRVLRACQTDIPTILELRAIDAAHEAVVDVGRAAHLWVSAPRTGERMSPLGLNGRQRKLSDILIDAKVPAALRASVPTVRLDDEGGGQIVWLAGLRVDERSRITASTARAVRLTLVDGSVRS